MAKFIYRMQNILDIKLKLESQAKIAYSQANAALREEEAKLLKLFERKNAYDNRAKELVEGKIDLLEIKKCRQAIESMKVLIRRQMMQVQVAEKNVEAATYSDIPLINGRGRARMRRDSGIISSQALNAMSVCIPFS